MDKQVVLDFIKDKDQYPLYFDTSLLAESDTCENNLDTYILKILRLTREYDSVDNKNYVESTRARRRSSLDIWRHAIVFKPDITIFEVMNSLYNLTHGENSCGGATRVNPKVVTLFCPDIRRRVFRCTFDSYCQVFNHDVFDEYDLIFNEWKSEE